MLGTIVNSGAIIAGSLVGLIFKGRIKENYTDTIMKGLALCVMLIGLMNAMKVDNMLLLIFSIVIGCVLGEAMNIEGKLEALGHALERKFEGSDHSIAKGFVTASLLFCVGSMAIIGSIESGLTGNHQTLFAKSILDGITSIIFSTTLGLGVAFSAAAVFVYQGIITICAGLLKDVLTTATIMDISSVGGVLIIALGFNVLEVSKIKVGNMLPAILVPFLYHIILNFF
ncbi:MAG: DUF554 domain-containing protein [Firmicutes bacterium]|jgi:uncharacterized membrane protein YqgA involved in biofilm formation|nr:DUF554 domain-containing protein [Bacillota bacterium]